MCVYLSHREPRREAFCNTLTNFSPLHSISTAKFGRDDLLVSVRVWSLEERFGPFLDCWVHGVCFYLPLFRTHILFSNSFDLGDETRDNWYFPLKCMVPDFFFCFFFFAVFVFWSSEELDVDDALLFNSISFVAWRLFFVDSPFFSMGFSLLLQQPPILLMNGSPLSNAEGKDESTHRADYYSQTLLVPLQSWHIILTPTFANDLCCIAPACLLCDEFQCSL